MGNTPYPSVLENLTPHLDAQECSAAYRISLADLLNFQISYQKQWFLLIRTGREAVDPTFTEDVIGNPAFRRWIGLLPRH
jgi:hypothetical protein